MGSVSIAQGGNQNATETTYMMQTPATTTRTKRSKSTGHGASTTETTLPEEMLVEIFSRLPAKQVLRLGCLSRSWAATLTSALFVELHLHQANSTPKLFLTTAHHLDLGAPNGTWPVKVLTKPCHGLVLLRHPLRDGPYYVFNPSTGELLRLPDSEECQRRNPGTGELLRLLLLDTDEFMRLPDSEEFRTRRSVTYGLACSLTTMEHKVVRIFLPYPSSSPCCEVISLDDASAAHWRWRAVAQKPPSCAVRAPAAVFCDGYLHFLLQEQEGASSIATFDVADETFGSLRTPPSAQDSSPLPLELTVLGGSLCLCVFRDRHWSSGGGHDPYCIWRLACREAGRWEKLCTACWSHELPLTWPTADLLRLHWVSPLEIYRAGNGREKIVFATEEGVLAYNLDGGGDPEMLVSPAEATGDSSGGSTIPSCTVGLLQESLLSVGRTSQGRSGHVRGTVQDNNGGSLTSIITHIKPYTIILSQYSHV